MMPQKTKNFKYFYKKYNESVAKAVQKVCTHLNNDFGYS